MFSGVFLENNIALAFGSIFMFGGFQIELLYKKTKFFLIIFFLFVVFVPYIYSYYYYHIAPRSLAYIGGLFSETIYVFFILRRRKVKYTFKQFFNRVKYFTCLIFHAFTYFGTITYLMPYIYQFFSEISSEQGKNYFQIVTYAFTVFFEETYLYILYKISYLLTVNDDLKTTVF